MPTGGASGGGGTGGGGIDVTGTPLVSYINTSPSVRTSSVIPRPASVSMTPSAITNRRSNPNQRISGSSASSFASTVTVSSTGTSPFVKSPTRKQASFPAKNSGYQSKQPALLNSQGKRRGPKGIAHGRQRSVHHHNRLSTSSVELDYDEETFLNHPLGHLPHHPESMSIPRRRHSSHHNNHQGNTNHQHRGYQYPPIPNPPLPSQAIHDETDQPLTVGDRVFFPTTQQYATVRFLGKTHFREGVWAGIELDTIGSGKNNGSVGGQAYFTCPPKTGLFVPPEKVNKISSKRNSYTSQSVASSMASFSLDTADPRAPQPVNFHSLGGALGGPLSPNGAASSASVRKKVAGGGKSSRSVDQGGRHSIGPSLDGEGRPFSPSGTLEHDSQMFDDSFHHPHSHADEGHGLLGHDDTIGHESDGTTLGELTRQFQILESRAQDLEAQNKFLKLEVEQNKVQMEVAKLMNGGVEFDGPNSLANPENSSKQGSPREKDGEAPSTMPSDSPHDYEEIRKELLAMKGDFEEQALALAKEKEMWLSTMAEKDEEIAKLKMASIMEGEKREDGDGEVDKLREDFNVVKAALAGKEAEIERLRQEMVERSTLDADLSDITLTISALERDVAEKVAQIASLERELARRSESIVDLESQLEKTGARLLELETSSKESKRLEAELSDTRSALAEKEASRASFERQLNDQKQLMAQDHSVRAEEWSRQLERKEDMISRLTVQHANAEQAAKDAEYKILTLEEQLDTARKTSRHRATQSRTLEISRSELEDKLSQHEAELKGKEKKCMDLEEAYEGLRAESRNRAKRVRELEELVKVLQDDKKDLEEQMERGTGSNAATMDRHASKLKEQSLHIAALEAEISKLNDEVEDRTSQASRLQTKVEDLRRRLKREHERELERKCTTISDLETQLKEAQHDLADLEADLRSKSVALRKAEQACDSKGRVIERLEEDHARHAEIATQKEADLNRTISNLKQQVSEKQSEAARTIHKLEEQVSELKVRVMDEGRMQDIVETRDHLRARLAEKEVQVKELTEKVNLLKSARREAMSSYMSSVDTLMQDFARLKSEPGRSHGEKTSPIGGSKPSPGCLNNPTYSCQGRKSEFRLSMACSPPLGVLKVDVDEDAEERSPHPDHRSIEEQIVRCEDSGNGCSPSDSPLTLMAPPTSADMGKVPGKRVGQEVIGVTASAQSPPPDESGISGPLPVLAEE